jgi:hypothetical protein
MQVMVENWKPKMVCGRKSSIKISFMANVFTMFVPRYLILGFGVIC